MTDKASQVTETTPAVELVVLPLVAAPKILGTLISKLDNPTVIKYDGEDARISPRARLQNIDKALLGELPAGLTFITN